MSEALAGIPGVARVVSLPQIKTAVDPRSQWDLRRFAAVTAPVDVFQRHLISPDHRVAGITLILADDANQASVTRNPERTNPSARPC